AIPKRHGSHRPPQSMAVSFQTVSLTPFLQLDGTQAPRGEHTIAGSMQSLSVTHSTRLPGPSHSAAVFGDGPALSGTFAMSEARHVSKVHSFESLKTSVGSSWKTTRPVVSQTSSLQSPSSWLEKCSTTESSHAP